MPVKTMRNTLTNAVHSLCFKKIRVAHHIATSYPFEQKPTPLNVPHHPSQLASLNMEVDTSRFTYFVMEDKRNFPLMNTVSVIQIPHEKLVGHGGQFSNDMLREYAKKFADPGEDVFQDWRERYDAVITDVSATPVVIHLDQPIADKDRIYVMLWDDNDRRIVRYLTKAHKRLKV